MKITRIAALTVILASTAVPALFAQGLQTKGAPAEVPPTSFKGKQYVDSRGCVYIRAGIDGNVTWVPRVDRSRKQLCGFQPSNIAGSTAGAQPRVAPKVELITVPQQAPTATAPVPTTVPSNVPSTVAPVAATAPVAAVAAKPVQPAKPRRTPATTSTGAAKAPVRRVAPQVIPAPAPKKKVVRKVQPAPKPAPKATGRCPGASALSQQYINKGAGVRCGPQSEDPLSFLTPNTRVMPAHVYRARLAEQDIQVPSGYRPVWTDGRLNPRRTERTLRPSRILAVPEVPAGYQLVDRSDGRLNPARGKGSVQGAAQMAQIWSARRGVLQPILPAIDKPIYKQSELQAALAAKQNSEQLVMRLSTRSASEAVSVAKARNVQTQTVKPQTVKKTVSPAKAAQVSARYVRAATYAQRSEALAAADRLRARTGLPVRLGKLRGGAGHVVLAGPFGSQADQALAMVRGSGHSGARLLK